ncbi:MAG: BREX system P-loop protein BrxC [Aquidulcibacter sp.]|uniref:BREX system P-loop protein BrxC n=1 Tax=Aquidulcibacter sp. TaxID=2052990 RepID=UPI0022BF662E|nr:BREX system P-loop protein BrxC [Aquidulcibacter sp.]MCZ8207527.1 BREX system P-loop protein BrxC [Aquidulcibacter sp.]
MTQKLKEIFDRPIDRKIEGVIKADDHAGLKTELDEYVITNEIERQLEIFLDAYSNEDGANGVWISGFFGSGKSHLLKMLAMVLENRDVEGRPAGEYFLQKVTSNTILQADLKKAVAIPSRSILFNIDQKSDLIAKTQIDALLGVFQKVFDEACGYYGKQPFIAQFERDLDGKGQFQAFRAAFKDASGIDWERGREQYMFEAEAIGKAVALATGMPAVEASGILDRYRADYRASIEDFAERVRAYIDSKGPKFRLNFFVDEVGQYIADNVKLMTNLQTVAESLNTKCRGRAWIVVTAQQEITAVLGDLTKQQQNDFSKIQARFQRRIPLNSQDVAEVIQRRLLAKTEAGINLLSDLYHRQSGNFKALFDFTDASRKFENFRDRDHFINSFPFVPYQYPLFQSAIVGLSQHNAFEGKHSSVGERSMLGVFQEVGKTLAGQDVGTLATFDQMFEGIRTALKSAAQQSIIMAENNLGDAFALKVLKALFLVKYVKEFKATARNIAILLLDGFDTNVTELRRKVEAALARLEQETYIQRNGELFEYLTNEEKDVEQEIKSMDIDRGEITKELSRILFEQTIKVRKLKHEASGQDFSFAQRLDGVLQGRDYELSVDLITPFSDVPATDASVAMQTLSSDHLVMLLPADERFRADLVAWKRTDKYVKQNGATAPDRLRGIIEDKGRQNGLRWRDLEGRARSLIGEARIWVRGQEIEVRGDDPNARLQKGFQALVDKVYTSLPMLRGASYGEIDIARLFKQGAQTLQGLGETAPSEPEQELLNALANNARNGVRTTVKTLLERFTTKPCGWSEFAVLALTAGLIGRGKLEASMDGALLEGDQVPRTLNNNHKHASIVLDQQAEFTAGQVSTFRKFLQDLMDRAPEGRDAKGLEKEAAAYLNDLLGQIELRLREQGRYPFLEALVPVQAAIKSLKALPSGSWVTSLPEKGEALLDMKEQVISPISRFMDGQQRQIFDEAASFLREKAGVLASLDPTRVEGLRLALADPHAYRSGIANTVKTALDQLRGDLDQAAHAARESARAELLGLKATLEGLQEWARVSEAEKALILAAFNRACDDILGQDVPDLIKGQLARFSDGTFMGLLQRAAAAGATTPTPPEPLVSTLEPRPEPTPEPGAGPGHVGEKPTQPFVPSPPAPQFVPISQLNPRPVSPLLTTTGEIEAYVDELRGNLLDAIAKGKRIKL